MVEHLVSDAHVKSGWLTKSHVRMVEEPGLRTRLADTMGVPVLSEERLFSDHISLYSEVLRDNKKDQES
ncbi:MAG: hypothetical protein EPO09_20490 [Aquabacterium sp.]|uniref:hypothetical protein n=1 Tax=Aquabacterium sp. TaxID=1872578 RepID=UPI001214ED6F|nr:hypothetical protein [Aquabacterium sp.]TAK85114.1 MAG: hypothetical protein EPO09_20490 [Aquabacterium sp.]